VASVRRRLAGGDLLQRTWNWFQGTLAGEFAAEVVELRLIDRALAMASKCFVALIPLSILSTALISGRSFGDQLVARFGLSGSGASAAHALFAAPDQVQAGVGLLGVVILVGSMLSLTRALARVYLEAWRLPPPKRYVPVDGLIWLLGLFVLLGASVLLHARWDATHLTSAGTLITTLGTGLFFLWTPFILLSRRVPPRRLVPTAVLSGLAALALAVGSAIIMPGLVTRDTDRYGLVGFTFSLVSWLFCLSLIIVGAAAMGALIDRRREAR
jgi:membrane protein